MGVNDRISIPFSQKMAKAGLTDDYFIKKLKEELEAEQTKFFQFEGKVTDSVNTINWSVRQRAREDAHRLRGDYPAETVKLEGAVTLLAPEKIKKKKERGRGN